LLGALDRDTQSPTAGSFDRDHWAWKFRDCPGNMLQTGALSLAWLYLTEFDGNPYYRKPVVLDWTVLALHALLDRQHPDGAFDSVGPNTRDHGVSLAMAHVLATCVPALAAELPGSLVDRAADGARRATASASRSSEDYAFISNHHALFALAWWRVGRWLQERDLVARAGESVRQIIAHQSDDGWFLEYSGPDPGYESLGLHYLAQLAAECKMDGLEGALRKSVDFYRYCVMPDGTVGGSIGSRLTSLWYPAGFELLAGRMPAAHAVAQFLADRLDRGMVVTPATVDVHNLPSLLHSYCIASAAVPDDAAIGRLPCEDVVPLRVFASSGIAVASTPAFFAICHAGKGGVISARPKEGGPGYEDAGYLARTGDVRWASSLDGLSSARAVGPDAVLSVARFGRVRQEVLTPLRFLVLRTLNLTLFRSRWLAGLLRRAIVRRLITGREPGPVLLERTVRFLEERIEIEDTLANDGSETAAIVTVRELNAIHMGSARYFHAHQLDLRGPPALEPGMASVPPGGRLVVSRAVEFPTGRTGLPRATDGEPA
jgi:hypothetical protein